MKHSALVMVSGLFSLHLLLSSCSDGDLSLPEGWQPEGPVDCHVRLDDESVGLLQPLDLTVWLYEESAAGGTGEEPPPRTIPQGFVGAVEVSRPRQYREGWLTRTVFHLRPTKPGPITIPSMPFGAGVEKATTPEFELQVTSVLRDSDDPVELEEPAAPFPPLAVLWPYFVGAGALLVAVLFAWWFSRRPRKEKPLPVEIALPPHVKAARALERLRHAERVTEAQIDLFYVQVSQILRVYLEERFGLHAPMLTTEEFLAVVEQSEILVVEHRQGMRVFLQQCDLVKFARLLPAAEVHEHILRTAEQFVEHTRVDSLPPEPGAAPPKVRTTVAGGAA